MTTGRLKQIEDNLGAAFWIGGPTAAFARDALELVAALKEAWEALDQVSSDDRMSEAQITATILHAQEQKDEAVRQRDEACAEVERLRETLKQLHLLTETALSNYWCVGVGREALDEIHTIKKGLVK